MLEVDKDRFLSMCEMRIDGSTYDEIGKQFNISRQRVEQIFKKMLLGRIRNHRYCFPEIEEWMYNNHYSLRTFSELISCSHVTVCQYLKGTRKMSLDFAIKVMNVTGLTLEEIRLTSENPPEDD